jgi:hypothetical protein
LDLAALGDEHLEILNYWSVRSETDDLEVHPSNASVFPNGKSETLKRIQKKSKVLGSSSSLPLYSLSC